MPHHLPIITTLALTVLLASFTPVARAQPAQAPPLPDTTAGIARDYGNDTGIARDYGNDTGIERDKRVLFVENFDEGTLDNVIKRWSEASNKDGRVLALVDDGPPGIAAAARTRNARSIEMTANIDHDTGGHLYKRLPRGVDRVFARFYVKFPADAGYIHHFAHLGGYQPATNWPQGGAGERPRGDDRFTVGIEPFGYSGKYEAPGVWNFYTYWPEMKVSAGGRYWGNGISPPTPAQVPRDRWQCVEVMLKLNAPDPPENRDGELALWLDGKLNMHIYRGTPRGQWTGMGFKLVDEGGEPFEGFRWRTTERQQINFFWLLHYVTPEALRRNGQGDPPKENRVRFDNIVIATEYVGPIRVTP